MNIHYDNDDEMVGIIYRLVLKGLKFNVITATQTIQLTGGY